MSNTPSYPLRLTLINWKTDRTYKESDRLQAHEQIIRPLFNASTEAYVYRGATKEPIELKDESILIPKRGKYVFDKTKECITGHEYLWNATAWKRGSIVMVLGNGVDFSEVFKHCYTPGPLGTPNMGQSPGAIRLCKEMRGKGIITAALLASNGIRYMSIFAPNEAFEELYRLAKSLCKSGRDWRKGPGQILTPNCDMRNHVCYFIKNIPDMIMNKCQTLAENDMDGLPGLKKSFFRNLISHCELHELTLHFFISYNHEKAEGKRLDIFFAFCGEERDVENVYQFLERPSRGGFILQKDSDRARRVESQSFTAACTLTNLTQQSEGLYFVSPWEMNEDARLIDMIHIMESLSEDSAYRVDIFPKLTERTLDTFRKALTALRQRVGDSDGGREVLRHYEYWLRDTDPTSVYQFHANIYAFGNNARHAQLLLRAAASEALQKGEYTVLDVSSGGELYPSSFDLFHGFPCDADAVCYTSEHFPNPIRFWPTLFTPEEMVPFFPFLPAKLPWNF